MKCSDNALNILTVLKAKFYKGIGRAWIINHFDCFCSPESIVNALNASQRNSLDKQITIQQFNEVKLNIRNSICKMKNAVDGIVAIGDSDFPMYRGNVPSGKRPIVLFYKGNLELLNTKNIAVIGLLNPDESITKKEKIFVDALVKKGVTIVSGLALGCDSIAHWKTLEMGGKTVAILPTPLTNIVPHANLELAKEILQKEGLLVSEYYEEAQYAQEAKGRYEERDRLQAIFSDGVILTASYAKNNLGNDSGSRLAMEYARKYGIPRAILTTRGEESNQKYDLNRQIEQEIPSPSIIELENLLYSLNDFIDKTKSTKRNHVSETKSLFNFL